MAFLRWRNTQFPELLAAENSRGYVYHRRCVQAGVVSGHFRELYPTRGLRDGWIVRYVDVPCFLLVGFF